MKQLKITVNNKTYDVTVEVLGEQPNLRPAAPSPAPVAAAAPVLRPAPVASPAPAPVAAGVGAVPSPMAGVVLRIPVQVGDAVSEGQELIVLEAMKMETPVLSPMAGKVKAILVQQGDAATEGQALVEISN